MDTNQQKEEKNVNLRIAPPEMAKIVVGALVLFLAVLIVSQAVGVVNKIKEGRYIGQESQFKKTIDVSGEGKILAKPDIGLVDLTVLSEAKTVAAAQTANTDKMNKITLAMKDLGIKGEDLQTINYNISPRYQYNLGRSDIIGYEVSQTLRVKIRQLDKTGQILERAAALGANQVGALSFTFDDSEKLKDEARQKAIEEARDKARALAAGLGVRLGGIVSFIETTGGAPTPLYYAADKVGMGGGGAAPEIQTGQNEITVNVNLTYEIY